MLHGRYFDYIWLQKDAPDLTTNMNRMHKDIKFKPVHENNGQINFLDLLLIWKPTKIEIDIFRKPATTDKTINFCSNQSIEHKIATFRYYIPSMHSLAPKRQQNEWTIIHYTNQQLSICTYPETKLPITTQTQQLRPKE